MNRFKFHHRALPPLPARGGFVLFSARELFMVTALIAGLFCGFERLQHALRLAPANGPVLQPTVHTLFVDEGSGDVWVMRHSTGLTRKSGPLLDEIDCLPFDVALNQCAISTANPQRTMVLGHLDGSVEVFVDRRRVAHLRADLPADGSPAGSPPSVSTTPTGDVICVADPCGVVHRWRQSGDDSDIVYDVQQLRCRIKRAELGPDGRTLMVLSERSVLGMWDLEDGTWLRRGETGHPYCTGWSLSPDGKRLATVGSDAAVRVWNLQRGKVEWEQEADILDPAGVAFSPCGRFVATGGFAKRVRVWSADDGAMVGDYLGHRRAPRAFAWSPDSRRLYSSGLDGEVLAWDVAAAQ